MKTVARHFFAILIVFLSYSISNAQLENLTFDVRVSNVAFYDSVTFLDPQVTGLGNIMEFDIYIQQTNIPANDAEIMRFALGQYYINLNWGYNVATPTAADTAGFAKFSYVPGSTDFTNLGALPTNPHVKPAGASTDGSTYWPLYDVTNGTRGGYLNLNSNNALGSSSDVQISGTYPGTKVGRYRLKKNVTASWPSPYFASAYNHMRWRLGPLNPPNFPSPFSKIFVYPGLGVSSVDVTDKGTFVMDTLAGNTFPVELSNFTATSNRNNVNLSWSTVREVNNSGFDIEKKSVSESEWAKVGNVAGNGNTEELSNYSFADRIDNTGKYNYRLKQIDYNGSYEYFYLSGEIEIGIPTEYSLSQNYPNPFNPSTNVEFGLSESGLVTLKIYNTAGKEVASLVNEVRNAGYYSVQFNASNLSSGMYFYRLTAGNYVSTKKMVLVK